MLQAYKHVSALLIRSLKRSPPDRRINTFYVLSAICRQSKMQLKAADKYGAPRQTVTGRFAHLLEADSHAAALSKTDTAALCFAVPRLLPQMPAIAEMLAEIPKDQHVRLVPW